jgi:hypothetical protein
MGVYPFVSPPPVFYAYPNAQTTGPAAAGFTALTAATAATIPATAPYPPFAAVQGDGSLLVEGYSFTAGMQILATAPVVFRGCRLAAANPGGPALYFRGGAAKVEYCQISAADQTAANSLEYCILSSANLTVDHCDLFWWQDAIQADGNLTQITVTSNYIHDAVFVTGAHVDAIQTSGNESGVLIAGNAIFNPVDQTSCIALFNDTPGTYSNVTISGNLLAGGGYCLYLANDAGNTGITDLVVEGNQFSSVYYPEGGFFGYATDAPAWGSDGNTWQGNYWHDGPSGGQAVPEP